MLFATPFAERCQAAYDRAIQESAPFVPSEYQFEQSYKPLVNEMTRFEPIALLAWVNASAPRHDPLRARAIAYYKREMKERNDRAQCL